MQPACCAWVREGQGSNVPGCRWSWFSACCRGVVLDGSGLCARPPPRRPSARATIAPALGWAVRGAAALPILLLAGFSTTTVAMVSTPPRPRSRFAHVAKRHVPATTIPARPLRSRLGLSRRGRCSAPRCRGRDHAQGRHRRCTFAPPIFDQLQGRVDRRGGAAGTPTRDPFFGAVGEFQRRAWPTTIVAFPSPPSSRCSRERAAGKPNIAMTSFWAPRRSRR